MKFRPNADLMASVFVHLMLLALIFLYSEVHQFDPVAADTVPVEIVTPQEVAQSELTPDPVPSPSPTPELRLPSLDKPVESAKPEPSAQAPAPQTQQNAPPPQKQATPPAPKPSPTPQHAAAEPPPAAPTPQTPPMPQPMTPQQAASPPPAYTQPEPDLSVKYNVMLGLPPDISVKPPADAPSGAGPGKDNFDAAATEQADVGSSVAAEFRRHLKTCLKLPPMVSTGDDVRIKLRVFMKPDGKLAASPLLIEATASEKGPLLLKSATEALQACQPYAMLPRDRYGEWKVLDLDFSPRDFAS